MKKVLWFLTLACLTLVTALVLHDLWVNFGPARDEFQQVAIICYR